MGRNICMPLIERLMNLVTAETTKYPQNSDAKNMQPTILPLKVYTKQNNKDTYIHTCHGITQNSSYRIIYIHVTIYSDVLFSNKKKIMQLERQITTFSLFV